MFRHYVPILYVVYHDYMIGLGFYLVWAEFFELKRNCNYYIQSLYIEQGTTSTYAPAQLRKDKILLKYIEALTKFDFKIEKCDLSTFYWLPKMHKNHYKSHFIQIQVIAEIPFETHDIHSHSC